MGSTYSNIILYAHSIYKFEYIGQAYGYYDSGKFTRQENVITFSSLISEFSYDLGWQCHNKVVDMSGVTFTLDQVKVNTMDVSYRLTSFGQKAEELNLINQQSCVWIK